MMLLNRHQGWQAFGERNAPGKKMGADGRSDLLHHRNFLDCIRSGDTPLTSGPHGLEVVRILEAASASLRQSGAAIRLKADELPAKTNGKPAAKSGLRKRAMPDARLFA